MIELFNDDCLDAMTWLQDQSIDLILTDPPYGTTACKWDSVIPLEPMWAELKRITKEWAAIVLTASQPFTSTLVASNIRMFKHEWIWRKNKATGHLNANRYPLKNHESLLVFCETTPKYNPQGLTLKTNPTTRTPRTIRSHGGYRHKVDKEIVQKYTGYPKSVLNFDVEIKAEYHPTQKPVALMEYLVKTYTNESDTVLDFTMGSGTTGVACKNLNRSFMGIEKDEKYFQIAQERIANA